MKEFDDDELKEITVPTASQEVKTQPTATATATAAAPEVILDEPGDVPPAPSPNARPKGTPSTQTYGWDSDSLANEGNGIIRIRPSKESDRPVRFSVLPGPLFAHRQHWVSINGQKSCRLCLSETGSLEYCCIQTNEDGKMHIIVPALQYLNTDSKGLYPKGVPTEIKVGYIDISPAHFKILRTLGTEEAPVDIHNADILMSYIKKRYEFRLVSAEARWKKIPAIKELAESELAKMLADGGHRLQKRLGKPTSLAEWKRILAERTPEPTLDNFETVPY